MSTARRKPEAAGPEALALFDVGSLTLSPEKRSSTGALQGPARAALRIGTAGPDAGRLLEFFARRRGEFHVELEPEDGSRDSWRHVARLGPVRFEPARGADDPPRLKLELLVEAPDHPGLAKIRALVELWLDLAVHGERSLRAAFRAVQEDFAWEQEGPAGAA